MAPPIVTATVQSAGLGVLSCILAQSLKAWKDKVRVRLRFLPGFQLSLKYHHMFANSRIVAVINRLDPRVSVSTLLDSQHATQLSLVCPFFVAPFCE